jgi:hypothetical protein
VVHAEKLRIESGELLGPQWWGLLECAKQIAIISHSSNGLTHTHASLFSHEHSDGPKTPAEQPEQKKPPPLGAPIILHSQFSILNYSA